MTVRRSHLANVKTGHVGLTRAGLVSQEKAETGLGQHVVIDGDPLWGSGSIIEISVVNAGLKRWPYANRTPSATARIISGSVLKSIA
jgi:hypothetical protein